MEYTPVYDFVTVATLIGGGFLGAFIDSTVGGGGLITLPALMTLGMPLPMTLGTNKFAASCGAITSFLSFWQAGMVSKSALRLMIFSFVGSILGAKCVYYIPEQILKSIIVAALVAVAIYTYFRKDWGDVPTAEKLSTGALIAAVFMSAFMGFYDGFFGPGTGSFLIFGFLFLGFNFVTAAGNAKALNFASNIGAFIAFGAGGSVIWGYGLIMGPAMMLGAFCGSRLAIKKGASYVRPLFLIVTTVLIGKQVWDIVSKM